MPSAGNTTLRAAVPVVWRRLAALSISVLFFFFSSRRRHTRCSRDWSSDVCSSDLPDFIADEANVVIAKVIINADPGGCAQAEQKTQRKLELFRWKIESKFRIEVQCAGQNDRAGRQQRADPQAHSDFADGSDPPIEQRDAENAEADDNDRTGQRQPVLRRDAGPKVIQILRKADVARSNFQGAAQDELPDEKKSHQSAERFAPETVAQINITAARTRHRRAQFAPDQRVGDGDQHSHEPA